MRLGPRSIAVSHRVVLCIAQFPGGSVGSVRVVPETEACSLCPDDSVLGGNGRYTPLTRDATKALRNVRLRPIKLIGEVAELSATFLRIAQMRLWS
jgi:hypothetical protein